MNSCSQAEKIVDYCFDQLNEEEKEEFLLHLKSCKVCQHELALEQAIESELTQTFDPGFIENKVRFGLQLQQARSMRSFWLYTFRMGVYGLVACISGFILIPLLLRFFFSVAPNLGNYANGVLNLAGRLAPGNEFYVFLGISCIAVVMASMYSLVQIRR